MLKENQIIDIIPATFMIPLEYSIFLEEFYKSDSTWIVKPYNRSQGKGIFLLSNIN